MCWRWVVVFLCVPSVCLNAFFFVAPKTARNTVTAETQIITYNRTTLNVKYDLHPIAYHLICFHPIYCVIGRQTFRLRQSFFFFSDSFFFIFFLFHRHSHDMEGGTTMSVRGGIGSIVLMHCIGCILSFSQIPLHTHSSTDLNCELIENISLSYSS